jgi:hypothetical protein
VESEKPEEVTLCDLYQHPEQYAGKMIKVRGGSVSGLEIEDLLHDTPSKPCPAYMTIVVVFPHQVEPAPGFQLVQDEAQKKLAEALRSSVAIKIEATYAGRFDAAYVWREQKRIPVSAQEGKHPAQKQDWDGRIVLRQVFDVWTYALPRK